ncbi:MAG: AAA family ATPase, partial [Defluviitaleaceae bacterium]|nr:AAA family ATPase [Defluviitaleaceae bacterium]
ILSGEKCRAENETVMAQLVETNRIIRNAVKNTAEAEESVLKSKNELENYVNLISEERNEKDFQTAEITNIKVRIGQLKQKMESEAENHSRLEKECAAIILERDVLFHERAEQKKRAEEKNEGIAEAIEQKERLTVMQNVLAEELAEIETRRSSISNAIEKADRDEREQQGAAAVIQQEIIRLTMRREQFETESREIYSNVWDEYGLTYQSALSYKKYDMSDAALKRDMKRLRDELAELQNVNVGAIESYKTIKDRFNFLSGQRDDIIRAETKLTEIIESLTAQMEETFAERFSIISNHFSEVFKEMFGGGSAGLSLSDEKNMLESGVEITAQPPGKRLQTISLLSGGERALTAIALLFGILRMKPSPFCVLDEIESALDDANVVRFAHFLKNHAQGTQFIVITHRKGTMEAADAMYGVTMQELGISKMVSVKFGDG